MLAVTLVALLVGGDGSSSQAIESRLNLELYYQALGLHNAGACGGLTAALSLPSLYLSCLAAQVAVGDRTHKRSRRSSLPSISLLCPRRLAAVDCMSWCIGTQSTHSPHHAPLLLRSLPLQAALVKPTRCFVPSWRRRCR